MSEEPLASAAEGAVDPFAASLVLSGASRGHADAFLDDQRHHLHEQLKNLHLGMFEKWLGVLLKLATLCVGIAAATGVGLMVRDAAASNGLIIEPFSVPPDLAARGLTGQAVASQVLDQLTEMQTRTVSARPPQSYANNWGSDLKVEIPETGVSLGELRRFLREWLGHDTHITGEVWHTKTGIAIIARPGGDSGEIVTGTEDELGDLIQKAAENVYRITQPYRYANYLDRFYQDNAPVPADARARLDQAEAIYRRLTYDRNVLERAWAWNGLGTQAWSARGNVGAALGYYRKALSLEPDSYVWLSALILWSSAYGHAEESLAAAQRYAKLLPKQRLPVAQSLLARRPGGDFAEMARISAIGLANPPTPAAYSNVKWSGELALASQHDARGARRILAAGLLAPSPYANIIDWRFAIQTLAAMEDWPYLLAREPEAEKSHARGRGWGWDLDTEFGVGILQSPPGAGQGCCASGRSCRCARRWIAATPLDCYDCLRIRGQIAALAGQQAQADAWFTRAIHDARSPPFAYADWGQVLLARGQPDGAIVQFKLASEKGPHFADPLEVGARR